MCQCFFAPIVQLLKREENVKRPLRSIFSIWTLRTPGSPQFFKRIRHVHQSSVWVLRAVESFKDADRRDIECVMPASYASPAIRHAIFQPRLAKHVERRLRRPGTQNVIRLRDSVENKSSSLGVVLVRVVLQGKLAVPVMVIGRG